MIKKNFTRKNLSNKLYQKLGFSKNFSSTIIDNFFDTLSSEIIKLKILSFVAMSREIILWMEILM